MTKERIRRWAWTLVPLVIAFTFFWLVVIGQETPASAALTAVLCGTTPLFGAGALLFAPSDSFSAPLRFLGRRPPTIVHSNEPEARKVIPRPHKAKRPR